MSEETNLTQEEQENETDIEQPTPESLDETAKQADSQIVSEDSAPEAEHMPDEEPEPAAAPFVSEAEGPKPSNYKQQEDFDFLEEDEKPSKGPFHFKKKEKEFERENWILSRISDDQLMDYLTLEHKHSELLQKTRDIREKRLLIAFILTISLAAIVLIVYFLKDEPSILVNVLYIAGIITAFWLWKTYGKKN